MIINLSIFVIHTETTSESYKILNVASQDLSEDGWSTQLIFFAFSEPIDNSNGRNYYVDSYKKYPNHHRVLSDSDSRNVGGNSGWEEVMQFWAFIEEQPQTVPYTILHHTGSTAPYRSQIIESDDVFVAGWTVHSVFWAYSTPGKSHL